jgi:hypothetical protein
VTRIAGQAPLTAAEKAQIAARYAAGETIKTLRAEYHRTRQTIKDIILAAGGEIRPPGSGQSSSRKKSAFLLPKVGNCSSLRLPQDALAGHIYGCLVVC